MCVRVYYSRKKVDYSRNLIKARSDISSGFTVDEVIQTPQVFANLLRLWIEELPGHLIPNEYLYPFLL